MKVLTLTAAISVLSNLVFCLNLTIPKFSDQLLDQLANLDYDLLPPTFKELSKQTKSGVSGWCCANEEPVKTIQRTKTGKDVIVTNTVIKVGYQLCSSSGGSGGISIGKRMIKALISIGGGGSSSKYCSVYEVRTRQQIQYFVQTYDVPDPKSCQDRYVRCCANYIDVGGVCFDVFMVSEHLDLLVSLGMLTTLKP